MFKRVLSFLLAIVLTMGLVLVAPPVEAQAASTMSPSEEVANYLKETEGFAAIPYWDYSQWTVGFGTRCPDEHFERYSKEGIPVAEAHALFAGHLSGVASKVNQYMDRRGITLNQHQFDALVCLTYNKGTGWLTMENEPVTMAILEGDVGNKFVAAISLTCYAGGDFLPALMRRRLIEADMYINGNYARVQGENYCYVRYDGNGGEVSRTVQGYNVDLPVEFYCAATRAGYTFLGWYTEPQGGTQITELSKATDEMTLYAHWEEGTVETEPFDPIQVTVTTYQLNVRAKPGAQHAVVGYVYDGSVQTVLAIQEEEGIPWGRIETGWINLAYTDYRMPVTPQDPTTPSEPDTPVQPGDTTPPAEEEEKDATFPDRLPLTGTVVGTNVLNVYNGPHNSYPKVSTLAPGRRITVLETYELFGVLWGRIESGWVRMDHCILFDGYQLLAHSFTATVNTRDLSVRSGPGTDFTRIGYVHTGTKLEITAVLQAGGWTWGMYEGGWVALEYSDYDASKLADYQNHSYGDWSVYQAATCAAYGQERRMCQYCEHYEVEVIDKKAHTYGSWYTKLEATCVNPGQQVRDCTACGHQEKRNTALSDHDCGDWQVVSAATCVKPGQERRSCAHCDYYETRATAMTEHSFAQWYTTKEPTDSQTGIARRECKVCGHYEEKILPVTEHIYGDWYVHTAATCTVEGTQRRDCSHCDHYETRSIAATGHTMSGWTQSTAPTCVKAGSERRICKYCDHSETQAIAATGKHSYGTWQVVKEATSTVEGSQRRDCKNCDHYETKAIACVPAATEKTYGTLTGWHYVNVRKGPGTNYDKVTTLNYGDKVEILEKTVVGGIEWGRYSGGWVCITDYLTLETVEQKVEIPAEPETPADPTPDPDPEPEKPAEPVTKTYGTLTGWHYVNVRKGPGTNYAKVTTLNYGDRVEILEKTVVGGIEWGRYAGGWVCITDYLTLSTVTEAPDTTIPTKPSVDQTGKKTFAVVTTSSLNVRQGPGTGYTRLGYLTYGTRVEITQQQTVGSVVWGKCEQGWICLTDYTRLETESAVQETTQVVFVVNTDVLNVRSGAGMNYDVVTVVYMGTKLVALEEKFFDDRTWVHITQGWVAKEYLTTSN